MSGVQKKTEVKRVKCRHCGNSFTLLLAHLKKKTDCQKAYGEEYYRRILQNAKIQASRQKGLQIKSFSTQ